MRSSRILPLLAAGVTVLLWASAFVGIRAAGEDLAAGPLSLLRMAVGAVVLGGFVLVTRDPFPARRYLPPIVACGLIWFGLYSVALNEAERRVDAGTAAMLVNLGPLLIALLAGVFLREGFPRTLLLGCAVAFAGTAVIGIATSGAGQPRGAGWGAVLCLVAALAYASAVVIQKPILGHVSGLQVTFLACTVGAIACLPFAPALVHEARAAEPANLAWAVYLGAMPTAVGFWTWAYALRRTTAGRMGATTYLVPPVAVLMGWALLGETPPVLALLGGALCLAGVALARRRPRAAPVRRKDQAVAVRVGRERNAAT